MNRYFYSGTAVMHYKLIGAEFDLTRLYFSTCAISGTSGLNQRRAVGPR